MVTWWEVGLELDRVRGSTFQEWCSHCVMVQVQGRGMCMGSGMVLCEGELEAEGFR